MSEPPQRLLHESLQFIAARSPEKIAVVIEGTSHSYANLLQEATQLAGALQQRGVQRGDRVAIYMDNTWPCVVSIFAILLAGGVFLVINPQTKSEKLEFILEDSDAKVLLTDAHLAGVFMPVLPRLGKLRTVICSGELLGANAPRVEHFNEAIQPITGLSTKAGTISLDLAALIYTSGSTGNAKGVMQTHQSMVFAAKSLIEYLRLSADDRLFCALPLAFDYGLYQLLMTIQLGATLVLERSFTYLQQVFQRMEEQDITVFPGVPTIFAMLLSTHARTRICFPSVTRVTNTAAALPDGYVQGLREIFPGALIYKMYGLTECKRVCYLEPELIDAKPGSVGKAIPGTETFLLSNDGLPLPPGEVGILHVRGPHVMLGYWKRPDLSAHMLREGKLPGERVLCTHDYFRMDGEGFLYFVGRSDDIIKTRGEKVSPVEVENVLHSIKGIREAAVVGVPDEILGQAIRAYVALEPDAELNEKMIRALCLARLENFMVPRDIVIRSELPKTATGKISKKALLQQETA